MANALDFAGTDRFKIIRMIGAGGMGMVYEADDRERAESVALKTLKNPSPETIYHLKREFRALTELSHPNLIPLYELFVGDRCFFTMELLAGVSFLHYVRGRDGPPTDTTLAGNRARARWARPSDPTEAFPDSVARPASDTLDEISARADSAPTGEPSSSSERPIETGDEVRLREIMPQLAEGLMALHAAGKIHRDVKPSNILVTPKGRLLLLDFGLVTDADTGGSDGRIVGTVAYMAPEQAAAKPVGPEADWYAVGVLLYEALVGRRPFSGTTDQVLSAKHENTPPRPGALVSGVPEDLEELCMNLLERDPADRPTGDEILHCLGAGSRTQASVHRATRLGATRAVPFVGREPVLAWLEQGLTTIQGGQASAMLVRGASGLGKSMLIRTFLDHARTRHEDIVVLEGRCYERETVAYQAMDSLIDHLSQYWCSLSASEADELAPSEAGLLTRLFPVLGRVPVVAAAPSEREASGLQEMRTRALSALRQLLGRLGDRRPLVLFLDDMQWADAHTRLLLSDLMRPPDPPCLLLILSSRPDESKHLEALIEGMGGASDRIDLEPLSMDASVDLATDLLGSENAELVERVASEAAGNPFFISQLVQHVQAEDSEMLGSIRLEEVVGRRVAKLSEVRRRVLELIALAAEPVTRQVLACASELEKHELDRELDGLCTLNFVQMAGARTDAQVEPHHDRIRDSVLSSLTPDARRSHHRCLALALGQGGTAPPERLARHWQGADEYQRAAEYAREAADEARGRLDFDRAADLYRMTLDLGSHDAAQERELLTAIGDSLVHAGRSTDAAQAFSAAADGADDLVALDLHRRSAEELLRGGYLRKGLEEVSRVLGAIGLRLAKTPVRALLSILLRRAWLRVRGLRWREKKVKSIPPEALTKIDICFSVSIGLAIVDPLRSFDYHCRSLSQSLQVGEPSRVARALVLEAAYLAIYESARRARVVQGMAEKVIINLPRDPYLHAIAAVGRSGFDFFINNAWRDSVSNFAEAEKLFRAHVSAAGWELSNIELFTCINKIYLGELQELSRLVPSYLRDAERRGDRHQLVSMRTRLNLVWLMQDDVDAAEKLITEAIDSWMPTGEVFQVQHYFAFYGRCELALYRGDAQAASAQVRQNLPGLQRALLLRVGVIRIEVLGIRSRTALARAAELPLQQRQPHLRLARKLARKLRRERLPLARAWAPMIEACAAQLAGDTAQAIDGLRAALSALHELETRLYENAVRSRLGQLVGGDEGAALEQQAQAWFTEQGVQNPARIIVMLVPGWPHPDHAAD